MGTFNVEVGSFVAVTRQGLQALDLRAMCFQALALYESVFAKADAVFSMSQSRTFFRTYELPGLLSLQTHVSGTQ